MNTRIDLFKLHNPETDTKLKSCIMAKGNNLPSELAKLMGGFNRTELVKKTMKEFNISITSAERLVYLKKEWFPLTFIEYLISLSKQQEHNELIQDTVEFIKVNRSPERIYKAVHFLTPELCKIVGAHLADGTLAKGSLIRITDNYEKNIDVLKGWIDSTFRIDSKKIRIKSSSQEWGIEIRSKILGRYLHKIFDFPYGCKQYTAKEPFIIKSSTLENRKAFAQGALTFEAGIGMKHQVELCVVSKHFRDDISEILTLSGIEHKSMEKQSGDYWRLWSNSLTVEQTRQWMEFFAEETDKWLLLKNYADGFQRRVDSFEEAMSILNETYPAKSASKVCLRDILEIFKNTGEVHRYQLAALICEKKNLSSYGGTWGHSLKHYLDILRRAKMISVKKCRFGKDRCLRPIIREVYTFNHDISSWRLP